MDLKIAYNYDFGGGWTAECVEEIYSAYKFGIGRCYVWLVSGLMAQPAAYYVCFGLPSDGFSGLWCDWLSDAVEYCDDCAR